MEEPEWRRWQVILGIFTIVVTLIGIVYHAYPDDNNPVKNKALQNISEPQATQNKTDPISVDPKTSISVDPKTSISVASSPSGASIYLDGTYQGITPMILNNTEIGSHTISIRLAGYKEYSEAANVDASKQITVLAALTPIEPVSSSGNISVASSPSGASIYLDDTYEGETPKILRDIVQGDHIVTLKLAEYKDWSQTISVDVGKTFSLSPTLTPEQSTTETSATTEISTETSTTKTPSAKIESVSLEHNVLENGIKGMVTHVKFSTSNLEGEECEVEEYFYLTSGEALKDFNQAYYSDDGNVASWAYYTPQTENDTCNDLTIFMPYSELHMAPGIYDLKFDVEIHRDDEMLTTSDWNMFTYTQY